MSDISLFENQLKKCIKDGIEAYKKNPNPKTKKERDDLYKNFTDLSNILGDYRLVEYPNLKEEILAGVYFTRKILEDLWENVAGDSSFGFENIVMSNNYGPLQRNVFLFWETLLKSDNSALQYMILSVKHYLMLLNEIEDKIRRREIIGE